MVSRPLSLLVLFFFVFAVSRVASAQPAPDAPDALDAGAMAEMEVDAGAPDAAPPPAPPAPAPAAPTPPQPPAIAPAPAVEEQAKPQDKPHDKEHHEERSPLVPDVDVRNHAKKAIDPQIVFRPGRGVTLKSVDGDFEMAMKIRAQILGTFEHDHSGAGETLLGAQIRRARLAFQGHMFGEHNKYKFEIAVSPRDSFMRDDVVGTAPLLDWYMTFDYLKPATLVVGQYKVPFSRQRVVSSGSLQMVDRSIVQGEFNLDRQVGLDVRSTSLLAGHLHYYAGIYPGEGRNAFELRNNNIVYLARVEILPFGKFHDYIEADFERTGPRVSIGGSYAHISGSARRQTAAVRAPADGGTTIFNTAEADVLLKMYGLSVTGELFWREGIRRPGEEVDEAGALVAAERPRDGFGYFGQFGYLLPHTMLEVTGRYGNIRTSGAKSSLPDRQELGGGLGHYFAQHSFKLQADYFRLWGAGGMSEGVDQVRLQLEAGF